MSSRETSTMNRTESDLFDQKATSCRHCKHLSSPSTAFSPNSHTKGLFCLRSPRKAAQLIKELGGPFQRPPPRKQNPPPNAGQEWRPPARPHSSRSSPEPPWLERYFTAAITDFHLRQCAARSQTGFTHCVLTVPREQITQEHWGQGLESDDKGHCGKGRPGDDGRSERQREALV